MALTQEAADLLHVSRPHLVKLLDEGTIPHHKVGTHRRVRIEDALNYRERRAATRREKPDELTRLSRTWSAATSSPPASRPPGLDLYALGADSGRVRAPRRSLRLVPAPAASDQVAGCNPARVIVTSRRTAALDSRLLAAARACTQ
ncbi:MAG: excisionase family DNA-binding protein [Thermoleophilaceae bacterium]|nr:excisionase family DNA-binding protein [Thermoleophilaceae bacterium]